MSRGEESDDEQIKYAIALSLKDQGDADGKQVLPEVNYKPSEAPSLDLLSLNRKQMEEDRLARIATKRSRMLSNEEEVVETPPPKRRTKSETYPTADGAVIPYPEGIVKRTWVRGYDRSNDDIKIEEVLQKDKLLLALFSSFQWDEPWLFNKIDASRTKVLLVAFAADETQKEITRRNAPSNVKFCFPDMHGPGSMHSKLQILKFPNYLRIVIPTGNLVPYDWGETGVMENMVFLIDLPLMEMAHKPHPATMFFSQLQLYLQAMGVEISMISGLSKYDFSKTKDIGLVYSMSVIGNLHSNLCA
ncbi:hypothetical protein QQS21_007855 [Conoideocrella luteorostrata]|uniref:Tyrosyl-DNA phosphodiesterase n=1 Tax=Conoideocrella luteorostrata TaxID=1105319 RepID=A0AAJ0CJY9_9HYPO|nr:hypothetical protein QQS21_007855 [Conoideocrella luteorostrata]